VRGGARLAGAALGLVLLTGASSAGAEEAPRSSLFAPRLQRGLTRVSGTLRPFLVTPGLGFGMISDVSVDHYFRFPLRAGVDIAPLALAVQRGDAGFVAHVRGHVAYAGDYIELGAAVGAQLQHFGASGLALAARLRLGALDGVNIQLENGYSLIRGYYTGQAQLALDHITGEIDVPVTRRLTLRIDGGFGLDLWAYATVGLKHYLRGQGGRGTIILTAAAGAALVVDRFPCQYGDPAPCEGAAKGFGPTVAAGVDSRF
jgi:hypothetical protein